MPFLIPNCSALVYTPFLNRTKTPCPTITPTPCPLVLGHDMLQELKPEQVV